MQSRWFFSAPFVCSLSRRVILVLLVFVALYAWLGIRYQFAHMDQVFFQASLQGRVALFRYLVGDYEGAARSYRRHFAEHPDMPQWLTHAGEAALLGGDLTTARVQAESALTKDHNDAAAVLTLAEVALHEGDTGGVSAYAKQVLAQDPDDPDALTVISLGAARAESYDKAIASLERTLRTRRVIQRYSLLLAMMETMGALDELPQDKSSNSLIGLYARYLRMFDPANGRVAIRHARKAISRNERVDEAYLILGVIHDKEGRKKQSLQAFRRAIESNQSNALAFWWASFAYGKLGDISNEYLMAKAATEAAVGDPFFGRHLTYVLMEKLGDVQQAVTYLQAAVIANPDHLKSREMLAYALDYSGRYDEALEHYRAVIRLDAKNPVHYENLAGTLDRAGRYDEAVATLRRAVELFPSAASAHLRLAGLHMERYRGVEATAEYEAARRLGSFDEGLCKAYQFANDLAHSIECFQEILKGDPTSQYANRNLPEVMQAFQYQRTRR